MIVSVILKLKQGLCLVRIDLGPGRRSEKMADGVPDLAAGAVLASSDEMPEGSEQVLSH